MRNPPPQHIQTVPERIEPFYVRTGSPSRDHDPVRRTPTGVGFGSTASRNTTPGNGPVSREEVRTVLPAHAHACVSIAYQTPRISAGEQLCARKLARVPQGRFVGVFALNDLCGAFALFLLRRPPK